MAETRDLVPASSLVAVQFNGSKVNLSLNKITISNSFCSTHKKMELNSGSGSYNRGTAL